MKRSQNKYHWILFDEVYEVTVLLFVNCSREQVEDDLVKKYPDYRRDTFDPDTVGYAGRIIDKNKRRLGYILWLKENNWTIQDYSTLAHEVFHLVNRILIDRASYDHDDNDEHYAYYISFWMTKILTILNNQRIKNEREEQSQKRGGKRDKKG